jgi:bisphosphoglycerate-dependent phosphoglycerate mutase
MPPPTIYYIRHGETDWNVAGRLQGRHDVPLNARGRTQANHCGNILRDLFAQIGRHPADFDYLSSPLGRACETMALVRPRSACLRKDSAKTSAWPKSPSENGKVSRSRNCATAILNALPPANTTSGILCRRAEKVTSLSRDEWANGMSVSRATL